GQWSHVFVTHDGTGKAAGVSVYVNGVPAKLKVEQDKLTGTLATAQPLRVGKRSTAFPLKGELTDVRVYRRTLAPAEVCSIVGQPIGQIVATAAEKRSVAQKALVT